VVFTKVPADDDEEEEDSPDHPISGREHIPAPWGEE